MMVPADFDVATFSVTLPRNSPVSIIAPRIDCDTSSWADVVDAGGEEGLMVVIDMIFWLIVESVWPYAESKDPRTAISS